MPLRRGLRKGVGIGVGFAATRAITRGLSNNHARNQHGMMNQQIIICTNCNTQNPADMRFCGGCSADLYAPPPMHQAQGTRCNCGNIIAQGKRFCDNCGVNVDTISRSRCRSCGADSTGGKFCSGCGQLFA